MQQQESIYSPITDQRYHSLRVALVIILGLLFFQFFLGMFANLFATFPVYTQPLGQGLAVGLAILNSGLPVVIVHALNGLAILGLSAYILAVPARRVKRRSIRNLSIVTVLSLIVAVYSGYHFVQSGWVENVYSYSKSSGFIFALMTTFAALLLTYRIKP